MTDEINKKDMPSRIKNIWETLRRLRLTWLIIKENPGRTAFWEQVSLLFRTKVSSDQVDLKEAIKTAERMIEHCETGFCYSLKDIDFIDSVRKKDINPTTYGNILFQYEVSRVPTLICDFTLLKIARALYSALEFYKTSELAEDKRRSQALLLFRSKLLDNVYASYDGLKRTDDILELVEKCIRILSSVRDG